MNIYFSYQNYNTKPRRSWTTGLESSTRCWRLPTFALKTIIGSIALNFSVRNGKRCDHYDKSPTLKTRFYEQINVFWCREGTCFSGWRAKKILICDNLFYVVCKVLNRNRNISTSQLKRLLALHLKPINVIISHGS